MSACEKPLKEIKPFTRFQHDYPYIALYEVSILSFLKVVLHHLAYTMYSISGNCSNEVRRYRLCLVL